MNLRFPGQYYDQETGLHYNYFRDYNPNTGHYIQSDPIGIIGGLNSYAYVNSNPIRFYDYYSLEKNCDDSCYAKCIKNRYGDLWIYAGYANPVNITGAGTAMLGTVVGLSAGYKITKEKFKNMGNTGGKLAKDNGPRIARGTKALGFISKASGYLGAFAFGFQIGGYGYCKYECW